MRIVTKNKQIISVLGLPHSGTTIIANTINSLDNAFCLSEPHWILLSNPSLLKFDKVKDLFFDNVKNVLNSIRNKLNNSNYDVGGVKETYRPQDKNMKPFLDNIVNFSDLIICVFRHPKALLNSHKVLDQKHPNLKNHMPLSRLEYDYIQLWKILNNKTIPIKLEDFCNVGEVNIAKFLYKNSNGLINIKGQFKLNKTTYKYGNSQAHNSIHIHRPNMKMHLLTAAEHRFINNKLMPIYQSIS